MGHLKKAFVAATATVVYAAAAHAAPPPEVITPPNVRAMGVIFSGEFSPGHQDVIGEALQSRFAGNANPDRVTAPDAKAHKHVVEAAPAAPKPPGK